MAPGDTIAETKTVYVPPAPPTADVMFAFDLTGSMGGIIDMAKIRAGDILTALGGLPGVDVQAGVISYMDYPASYDSYGYAAEYGYGEEPCFDYAYRLDQAVTADDGAVTTSINDLVIGCGSDGPQDYTRIFYESYADPLVGFRDGAKRILLNFGDNVPHDDDLNWGVSGTSGIWSTGGDPGRDEIILNADDLDLQTVLGDMASDGVVLLEAHTTDYAADHWNYWTFLTGGSRFVTSSTTLVDDVVAAITAELTDPSVSGLHLEASTGFEGWLTSVIPASQSGPTDASYDFNIEITVPDGTPADIYEFTISALDDVGVNYGDQEVMIVVYDPSAGFVTGGGWIDSPAGAYYPSDLPFFEGSYYDWFYTEEPVSFLEANQLANGLTYGTCTSAHLTTITSQEEYDAVLPLLDVWGGWLPLGGFQDEGVVPADFGWQWVTGEPFVFEDTLGWWQPGEPNDCGSEGCPPASEQRLVMYNADSGHPGWNDEPMGPSDMYSVEYEGCNAGLTGKATFGFVSKYKKGASIPTGNTEFQFHAAGLNFHSDSYDWLVVTGSNFAKFKGVGTINGEGTYKFQIWAGDNDPDTFRIKIWYEDGGEVVVYDNGMDQEIGAGSIVIHSKK